MLVGSSPFPSFALLNNWLQNAPCPIREYRETEDTSVGSQCSIDALTVS